jgi:Flp pilus assembly protein TadB
VSLYIREVKQLRAQLQPGAGYTQELKDGFTATLRGVGAFFMELFKFVVIALPAIVLLAVVFFVVFFIVKRKRARRAKRADADAASRGDAGAAAAAESDK